MNLFFSLRWVQQCEIKINKDAVFKENEKKI